MEAGAVKKISREKIIEDAIIARPDLLGYPHAPIIRRWRVDSPSGLVDLGLFPKNGPLVLVEAKAWDAKDAASKCVGQLLMYYGGALRLGSNGLNILRTYANEHKEQALSEHRTPHKMLTGKSRPESWAVLSAGDRIAPTDLRLFLALDGEPHNNLYDFKTPENAKKHLEGRYFIGGGPRIAEQTESRDVIIYRESDSATIQFVAGKLLIYFGPINLNEAINFENNLPYAALGIAQPPPRSADNVKEQPILALTVLDDFNRDRKAAEAKYHGEFFLFSGTVAGTGKTEKGVPFIAIQKPGTKVGMDSVLSCSFVVGDAAKIAQLKNGETVQFRGKVNTKLPINMVMIEDCRLE